MATHGEILSALKDQLRIAGASGTTSRANVSTSLPLFDAFASTGGGLASGAIHEVLAQLDDGTSVDAFTLVLASSVARTREGGWIVWSDPHRTLYPPALKPFGIATERLLLLRPRSPQEELWAIAECMRCPGVAATIAHVGRVTPVQARRLQLAVEQGGGIGVLIRPDDKRSANYAAATRWRVSALASNQTLNQASVETSRDVVQRWQVELAYGHGGRVGKRFVLEVDRETGRASAVPAAHSERAVAQTVVAAAEDSVRRAADLAERSRATATG